MTTFHAVTDLKSAVCASLWQVQKKPVLGKLLYEAVKTAYNLTAKNTIELIFNEKFISVESIDQLLQEKSKSQCEYILLAVNKFLIYSETDRPVVNTNFDLALLTHWQQLTAWIPVYCHYIENDQGLVGNFEFPVTQMLLKCNDQK